MLQASEVGRLESQFDGALEYSGAVSVDCRCNVSEG
jgi:hypothetical protein